MRPSNEKFVTIITKEKYIVIWDSPDGKSITVRRAVMKRWYLTNNKEINDSISDGDSDDRITSRNINTIIASSDDINESDNSVADS